MTQAELDTWADKAFASFERKEAKAEKERRAQAWAEGNGFRQSVLRGREAARKAVSDRLGHHS